MTFPFHFAANHWAIDIRGQHDALTAAAQAVEDWDEWLRQHGVQPPPVERLEYRLTQQHPRRSEGVCGARYAVAFNSL